ncbi:MAG: RpiB/LacA/LacB family sugar-phosphate isomerase [Candidatus Woesebacteria bacterium]|nr:MAG: RpiB/LacA/LacB family sugar-phosphate isomerase [Candidatus Woesebacteria bacterium]
MKDVIYLGADHRGFELKEKVARWLFQMGYEFEDVGADKLDPTDDYTKYAEKVGSVVGSYYLGAAYDRKDKVRGILICGSGVGIEVVANKFDGVRAAIGKSVGQIKAGRNDDDMNVLVLAADYTTEKEAKAMLIAFLETKFSGKERYEERLEEITRLEENN